MSEVHSTVAELGVFETTSDPTAEQLMDERTVSDALVEEQKHEEAHPEEVEESKEGDKSSEFDSKFAALSRREKSLRQKEQSIDDKLAQLEERFEQLSRPQESAQEEKTPEIPLEMRLKKDPLNTLKELGYDFQTLTDLALNDGKLTPEMQIQLMREEIDSKYSSELETLRNELREEKQTVEEKKYEDTIQNFKFEIADYVDSSEGFDLIKAYDARDQVYDVISEHHKDTGRVMNIEEASNYVEEYLMEEAKKLMGVEKFKKLLNPEEKKEPVQEKKPSGVTLSNSQASTVSSEPGRLLSEDDSKRKAAKLLRWND